MASKIGYTHSKVPQAEGGTSSCEEYLGLAWKTPLVRALIREVEAVTGEGSVSYTVIKTNRRELVVKFQMPSQPSCFLPHEKVVITEADLTRPEWSGTNPQISKKP